jgi:hypothetical protein
MFLIKKKERHERLTAYGGSDTSGAAVQTELDGFFMKLRKCISLDSVQLQAPLARGLTGCESRRHCSRMLCS